ncbi:Alpha/Beta hydrolase protein [Pyrenochaeta sp. MPI-SDFR-AT-0127]|nr:Alpha/Beta hydrolase protein [Pyrenochaeta sp. MPI-SDFR-AT-0127]
MTIDEGSHTLGDGHKVYTKTFKAVNTYGSFFPTLASKGIEVYTFDQRGWGRSVTKPSERGHTGPTTQVLNDITSFIKTLIPSPVPLFLMGHSMGGGEVLCYAAQAPQEVRKHIRGYLLESPFVDFDTKSKPSPFTVFFGRLAGKLLPHRQLVNKLDSNLLSRDPDVCKRFVDDELCHDTGTLEGLSGLLDRTGQLSSGKIVIPDNAGEGGVTRIWIGHGDKDGVTDYHASKRLADALQVKDKEFRTYAGYYHRLHDEPGADKQVFMDDVTSWILARSADPVGVDSTKSSKL